jgi:tetratricopeptide (TPR) repeat protein
MAAHDFYARCLEAAGQLVEAQAALGAAAALSPHNTQRQRRVGDIALRNGDLETAEQAYQTALRRARGSSLVSVEDYTNLSRVFLDQGKVAQARTVALDLRRDRRNDPVGEVAASITESLCYRKEGDGARAQEALDKALATRQMLLGEDAGLPEKIAVDLAEACFGGGRGEEARDILRQVAYESVDDAGVRNQIEQVFSRAGDPAGGRALLEQVSRDIGGAQAASEEAARSGDLAGSLEALCRHADRIPNVQFLVNAANAVFALMDQQGWKNDLAEHGLRYLLRAQAKDPKNPKVVAANDLFQNVAQKYGVSVSAFRQQVLENSGG